MADNKKLYHYTSSAGLIGILEHGKIWASEIRFLNDMQEFSRALQLIQDLNMKILRSEGSQDQFTFPRLQELLNLPRHIITGLFVTSFSEEGNHLGQWRGYCPEGGFSIGFNADYLKEEYDPQRCLYETDDQIEYLEEYFTPLLSRAHNVLSKNLTLGYTHEELENIAREHDDVFSEVVDALKKYAPFVKHEKFREEKEWRIVKSTPIEDESVEFRAGKYQPIPYICLDVDVEMIEQIVIGPTPEPDISLNSVRCLLRRFNLSCDQIVIDVIPFRSW